MGLNSESVLNMASSDSQISGHPKRAEAARCKHKQVCKVLKLRASRPVFTSDGSRSRSRREPYALVKTARHKQKQKEMFPFSSASASVASENQP